MKSAMATVNAYSEQSRDGDTSMKKHVLAVLAYVAATFITQATSHFVINADHYAALTYLRKDPIFPLGFLSMLIQGSIFSYLYMRTSAARRSLLEAVKFSWLVGGALVSYIALAEAAKYSVPAVVPWIAVEAGAGFVQFTFYGILLGFIHRERKLSSALSHSTAIQ